MGVRREGLILGDRVPRECNARASVFFSFYFVLFLCMVSSSVLATQEICELALIYAESPTMVVKRSHLDRVLATARG